MLTNSRKISNDAEINNEEKTACFKPVLLRTVKTVDVHAGKIGQ